MDQTDLARLDWQRAQADLQKALAEMERLVASASASPADLTAARAAVGRRQSLADEMLHRYITHLGKS